MEEKYLAAKKILEKYHQEHLLNAYDEKGAEEKKLKLLDDILTIDFNQLKLLYEQAQKTVEFGECKIEPIAYVDKDTMPKDQLEHYKNIGEKAIKEKKLAVVTMAGGQGTRLGHSGPKGTFDIGLESHKSIFELLCEVLKRAKETYGTAIPWYLMTSDENNDETVKFFEEHNHFGYPKESVSFFKQGKLPMVNEEGEILLTEEGEVKQAADGHGGIFESMFKNGVTFDMKTKGIEWIFVGGVDNVLVKMVDPVLMGLAIEKNVPAAGKSVVKAGPKERVGVFCKRNGKPSVVEYTEITDEMAERVDENGQLVFGESHILCNLFNIKAIEKISENKLIYHSAHKKASYLNKDGKIIVPESPNAYKFEAFLFDAFETLEDMAILRVKREEEFAPVKNAQGSDSPETARKLYEEYYSKNCK